MLIKVLAENTTISEELGCEHGLCLYIEANNHKILFDVGASDLFARNAVKLGVDIGNIDYLIISHGHYDHGGGLGEFFEENKKAEVFIHNRAFGGYYALRGEEEIRYIGLEECLKKNKKIVLTSDRFFVAKGIELFSNISGEEPLPVSNKGLLMEEEKGIVSDRFLHEQILVIEEEGESLLVTGCAHNGIVNILQHYSSFKRAMPDHVVGGFHLTSRSGGNAGEKEIRRIGRFLKGTGSRYHTCHCTGLEPYYKLKRILGENIEYVSVGSEIRI